MKIELDGHKTTGTYEVATPPQGRKPVGAKWVFTYETDKDGLIVKTKARLVAKGFSQVQDVDYTAQVYLAEGSVGRSPCVVRPSNYGGQIRPIATT